MIRPRKGFCIGNEGTHFLEFPCSKFHEDNTNCNDCKRFDDYE
jgi:hypothetical protein